MVIRQSETFEPYIHMPSARSLLAISLAPLQAASTLGISRSCSGRVVVLSENSTRYFVMMNLLISYDANDLERTSAQLNISQSRRGSDAIRHGKWELNHLIAVVPVSWKRLHTVDLTRGECGAIGKCAFYPVSSGELPCLSNISQRRACLLCRRSRALRLRPLPRRK